MLILLLSDTETLTKLCNEKCDAFDSLDMLDIFPSYSEACSSFGVQTETSYKLIKNMWFKAAEKTRIEVFID